MPLGIPFYRTTGEQRWRLEGNLKTDTVKIAEEHVGREPLDITRLCAFRGEMIWWKPRR
jgi:hypothetical protein